MAQFSGTQRLDPYKNFKFRLWDGSRMHAGSMSTGLRPPAEVVKHREGDDPSTSVKSPGRTKYDAITLERGVTYDQSFTDWASQVWNYAAALGANRESISVQLYDEAGSPVVRYTIYNGWVSESPALPPGGTIRHGLHPARGSVEKQLAKIFESSLRRLMP